MYSFELNTNRLKNKVILNAFERPVVVPFSINSIAVWIFGPAMVGFIVTISTGACLINNVNLK